MRYEDNNIDNDYDVEGEQDIEVSNEYKDRGDDNSAGDNNDNDDEFFIFYVSKTDVFIEPSQECNIICCL